MKLTEKTFEIKIDESYYTSDLCLAAILKLNNFKIVKCEITERNEGYKKMFFYFKKEAGILKVVDEYYGTTIENNPYKQFYAELRELKNLIYRN